MRLFALFFVASLFIVVMGFAQTSNKSTPDSSSGVIGVCSYYAQMHNGHITAGGEKFDSEALTAAHRKFPIGTKLKVTNLMNDKSVFVRVNDRGPFVKGRDLSVTRRAARELGFIRQGLTKVRIEQQ